MAFTTSDGPGITASQALRRLVEGNRRFVRGEARFPTVQKKILSQLAREQRPYATILGCSDSRVPPELLFDAGFGELFVIRVAGNVMSPEVAGSLQYAGVHLKTPLYLVLGHEGCGAVAAALAARRGGSREPSRIAGLLDTIIPGLRDVPEDLSDEDEMARAVDANVRWSIRQILETPEGQRRLEEGRVRIVGAVYEIQNGRVRFLD